MQTCAHTSYLDLERFRRHTCAATRVILDTTQLSAILDTVSLPGKIGHILIMETE